MADQVVLRHVRQFECHQTADQGMAINRAFVIDRHALCEIPEQRVLLVRSPVHDLSTRRETDDPRFDRSNRDITFTAFV